MNLSSIPHLVKEWHPTKNGELTPNNLTHGSNKRSGGYALKVIAMKEHQIQELLMVLVVLIAQEIRVLT